MAESEYVPRTPRGHELGVATSALQKAIRRGDEVGAATWAAELDQGGFHKYMWHRLAIVVSEDVGLAWPEGPAVIGALRENYERHIERKGRKGGSERLFVLHAALLLARAPKSRIVDVAIWAVYAHEEPMVEIPDYVFDRHTKAGRQQGRGWEHWLEESSHIDNRPDDESLDERQGPFWGRYLATKENQRGRWWLRGLGGKRKRTGTGTKLDTLFDQ